MVKVRRELCLGCGLCTQNCPQGAIYLVWGQAEIDPNKCNSCGLCLQICPQGAIAEKIAVSPRALTGKIQSMRKQTDDILARISKLSSTSPKNQHKMA
ncbi:MAG: 4Fe-4S binding protein [Dehalococcoidia bacterium]|nr:4Fe-4S binding protein [Dehalococcoidia bacterium]